MTRITFIMLILVLAACGRKEVKIVDLSDRIPKAKRDYNAPDTTKVVDTTLLDLAKFQSWNPEIKSIRTLERKSFLERFQPKKVEKFVWYLTNGDSVEYERLVFVDSLRTYNAFYNYLDRMDIAYFGAEGSFQKDPLALLLTDTVILRLSGGVDFKFWEAHIDTKAWMGNGDIWITQKKYRNAQWFVLEEDKLTDLTNSK